MNVRFVFGEVEHEALRRILLVRLDNLGDVLLTTPAFRAVRQTLPEAHLTLLAGPAGCEIGRLDPDIDETILYRAPNEDVYFRLPQDPERELAAVEALRERDLDAAIIFTSYKQSALPAAYLCYLAGIPLRAAGSFEGPGSLLTHRHRYEETVDRKSTRLNSSHANISYAVFCLKKNNLFRSRHCLIYSSENRRSNGSYCPRTKASERSNDMSRDSSAGTSTKAEQMNCIGENSTF